MNKTIKTIKTTKKLNLPELIHHVWENKVFPSVWRNEDSPSDSWSIQFFESGMFRSYKGFHDYDTFTVEVEEEITEDTKFEFVVINTEDFIYSFRHNSIKESMNKVPKVIEIFAKIDGRLQKVWGLEEDDN